MSWTIHGLCENPNFQRKLRAEVSAMITEAPTYDELNSLPLLDAAVREGLRTYSIDPVAYRSTAEDTVLPLSKPYVDKVGKKQTSILCVKCKSVNLT